MSTIDPVAAILADLDRPVAPRPEFADALLSRLLGELRASVRGARRGRRPLPGWFLPGMPLRLRFVLILVALLLFLAGIATATYLSVHSWVSAGPRGIQYASDYALSTVFTPPDESAQQANYLRFRFWGAFTLDPRGHDLYALHRPVGARLPELVRIRGVDHGTRLSATRVLDLMDLAGSRFQPAWLPRSDRDSLAVASNGDVFLLVAGRDPASPVRLAHGDAAIFVLHPNGARQRVVSLGELVRSGSVPNVSGETLLSLAASAPDRLWLRAESFAGSGSRNLRHGSYRLFEIVDPNADGDWGDRVVRPIALPRSVQFGRGSRWFWWQLVAEPPLPGDDRARSALSTAQSADGRFRVYRIADLDDDGDALDRGEVQVVYDGNGGGMVAPAVLHTGGAAQRGLVLAGVRVFNRISLVTGSGVARDIARSFPTYFDALLAGANGDIYPVTAGIVYRLEPAGPGARTGTPVPAAVRVPPPALPPPAGVPQLLFSTPAPASVGIKDAQGPQYAVGADGSGLRKLPNGAAQCFSRDGHMIAFTSDAEVPYEPSAYFANADGSRVRKLERKDAFPLCPFSTPAMWLWAPGGFVRYDLRTGHAVGPALHLPGGLTRAPDGNWGIYLGERPSGTGSSTRGHRPLVLLDLNTLRQRELGPPVPAGSRDATREYWTYGIGWSPDGTRIAYVTVPRRPRGAGSGRYRLFVRDLASGSVIFSTSIIGSMPRLTWSPDGASLLVCVDDRDVDYFSCTGGAPAPPARSPQRPPAKLLLVGLSDRSTRLIVRAPLVFADWAPSGGALAYATPEALFVRTRGGRTRKLASAPEGRWPGGQWLGWSPDGRYIGLNYDAIGARGKLLPLATVDVRTGRVRVIRTPPRAGWATWWQR